MHLTEGKLYSRSNTAAEESEFFYYHTQQDKGLNSFYSYLHRLPTSKLCFCSIWARRKTKEGKAFKEDSPQKTYVPTMNTKLPFNLLRTRSGDTHLQTGKHDSDEAQLPTEHLTCERNELHPFSSNATLIAVVYLLSSCKYEGCQKFAINA